MSKPQEHEPISLTFSNYNYSFYFFHTTFKELCNQISQTDRLDTIMGKIGAFMGEFEYALANQTEKKYYRLELLKLKSDMRSDKDLKDILRRDLSEMRFWIPYARVYYRYYLRYLSLLGQFSESLTNTFMPHTNIQKKMIRFFNSQNFFETFINYKKEILLSLSNFNLNEFRQKFDRFLTFYSAYKLFVTVEVRIEVEMILSLLLSRILTDDSIKLLSRYPDFNSGEQEEYNRLEEKAQEYLLLCNSLINESFSDYGVLIKLNERKLVDRTLI